MAVELHAIEQTEVDKGTPPVQLPRKVQPSTSQRRKRGRRRHKPRLTRACGHQHPTSLTHTYTRSHTHTSIAAALS